MHFTICLCDVPYIWCAHYCLAIKMEYIYIYLHIQHKGQRESQSEKIIVFVFDYACTQDMYHIIFLRAWDQHCPEDVSETGFTADGSTSVSFGSICPCVVVTSTTWH